MREIKNLTDEELVTICDTFCSASEYLRSLNMQSNGRYTAEINSRRKELNLEWKVEPSRIQNIDCPICLKSFKPSNRNQMTCSVGCANTFFRSGENNHNYYNGKGSYRTKCFAIRNKKCIICEESNIVEVHHYDENHDNNDINNLIPLCPTHHQYFHSQYKDLVEPQINQWRNTNMI